MGGMGTLWKCCVGRAEIIHCGWGTELVCFCKILFICAFGETLRSAVWGMVSLIYHGIYIQLAYQAYHLMSSLLLKAPQWRASKCLGLCFFPESSLVYGAYSWPDFKTRDSSCPTSADPLFRASTLLIRARLDLSVWWGLWWPSFTG